MRRWPLRVLPFVLLLVVRTPVSADALDDYLRAEMQRRQIPGLALAVVRNGTVVKLGGYGFANLEHDVPVTPDTVFELASVTKQFTATAIMVLVEEGKVRLDEPVGTYLTGTPDTWKGITVRHLLTHTAGLPTLEENFRALWPGGMRLGYSTAQLFDAATRDALSFAAGDRFQYSDVGYFLLGMIIEKASGTRYAEFLDERFFRPLGMTSTSVLDHTRVLKHRAAGYTLSDDGRLVNIRRVVDVELPSHFGVFSSVKDLVTWDAALAAGRVVTAASLSQMWTPVRLTYGGHYPYGYGWFATERRGHRWISHSGITGTEFSRLPDDGLTVIVLTNLGQRVGGAARVNAWGLTYGVAGRYLPGLHVGPERAEPDPDPAATAALRETLGRLARGEDEPRVLALRKIYLSAAGRRALADDLGTLQAFTFVTCDDTRSRPLERHGERVSRVCHYRLVNASTTSYYSFWLLPDGRIADFWSSTE
jgi:CubicO group peptidase (beta-lactamase class C family)